MRLGITATLHEKERSKVAKRINTVNTFFLVLVLLPFLLYGLFHFHLIPAKSPFSVDIQEPVAKVVTKDGIGTAFLINSTTLLTARHVVAGYKTGDQVDLIFEHSRDQYQTKGTIQFVAPYSQPVSNGNVPADYFLSDVAVLKVSEITSVEPLMLGESGSVVNLDEVVLIGYPNGDYSITKGNINSITYQGLDLFKLDATANPGNSGGPCILKSDNTVVGILVGNNATAQQGENISLKIDEVKKIMVGAKIGF